MDALLPVDLYYYANLYIKKKDPRSIPGSGGGGVGGMTELHSTTPSLRAAGASEETIRYVRGRKSEGGGVGALGERATRLFFYKKKIIINVPRWHFEIRSKVIWWIMQPRATPGVGQDGLGSRCRPRVRSWM